MNVFVTGAEFGVVRYIGHTEFAEGVWLGIELRRPSENTHTHTQNTTPALTLSLSLSLSL